MAYYIPANGAMHCLPGTLKCTGYTVRKRSFLDWLLRRKIWRVTWHYTWSDT